MFYVHYMDEDNLFQRINDIQSVRNRGLWENSLSPWEKGYKIAFCAEYLDLKKSLIMKIFQFLSFPLPPPPQNRKILGA